MIKPKRVLELGTFTGYSALCFAEGMPGGAELHTVEINDELEDFIRQRFDESPQARSDTPAHRRCRKIVPSLGGKWDLVFIDANKRNYLDYYNLVLPHVNDGGFIIADNTLWYGKVADKAHMTHRPSASSRSMTSLPPTTMWKSNVASARWLDHNI